MKARAYAQSEQNEGGILLHSGRRMRAAFKLPPVNGPSKKYAALILWSGIGSVCGKLPVWHSSR